MIKSAKQLAELEHSYNCLGRRSSDRCAGPGCAASGSRAVYDRLVEELTERGSHVTVDYLMENGPNQVRHCRWKAAAKGFAKRPPRKDRA